MMGYSAFASLGKKVYPHYITKVTDIEGNVLYEYKNQDEYILNKRIELSLELLKTRTITETAFLLCFSSSQHFSRAFKDRTNMTPREYILSQKSTKQ